MSVQQQPNLSGKEWGLVVELLEQESDELPVEIHHTEAPKMRDDLHERASLVKDLLERLHRSFPESRRANNVGGAGKGPKPAARRPSSSKLAARRCCTPPS
jgi:hypothetical protein